MGTNREFINIKRGNIDKSIDHIEIILRRMARRLHRTIVTVIPPSPIYGYVETPNENGDIFKCVLPASGEISKVCMVVSKYTNNNAVDFKIRLENASNISERKFSTKKKVLIETVSVDVLAGDLLTFSTNNPEAVKGIWSTILYHIDMPESKIKEVAFEGLNELLEDNFSEGI